MTTPIVTATSAADINPRDEFTPEEKRIAFASDEYEKAYHHWIKSGLWNLSDFEKYQIMHGRSFKPGERSMRMPDSWRDSLIKNLQDRIPNLPIFEDPKENTTYRREMIYFPVVIDSLEKNIIDFHPLMLEIVASELPDLIHGSKSINNNIYITRGIYMLPSEIEFFVVYFYFEIPKKSNKKKVVK